jgi:predicted AlkP superfamily phosphohydrolase/phosphomutase
MSKRKVAVIGLDSITPMMVERFIAEGRMPNLQRLRERGWSSEMIPTMPPTTPAGWTTIATGAWPSTHGIEGFAVHVEGDPLDKKTHSCSTERVKAEFIWQAAERAGKQTILLKYPMSWPPRGGDSVLQVDGAGGWGGLKCVWDLVHSACWDTTPSSSGPGEAGQNIGQEEWLTRDQDNIDDEHVQMLEIHPPGTWMHLPAGAEPLWETQVELRSHGMAHGASLYCLAVRIAQDYQLVLAQARDSTELMLLHNREWSQWLRVTLPTSHGIHTGHLRLKVMAFDALNQHLRLYQTQMHQEDGYTQPEAIATELLTAVGPFVEWTESYDFLQGWIDDETQLEIYEQHVEWMSLASQYLLRHHEWDLFMTQVHFIDMAYHIYWGAIDPAHPQYDAEKAPRYWQVLARVHELADRLLGAILAELDEDTLVIVLGDHGHDLYHTAFLANHSLLREGLLVLYRDRRTGEPRIDWDRTRAFANGYRIYLNVKGRDPQGIVTEDSYWQLQETIIQMLYAVHDPRTGHHPIRLAMRREDAISLGLYGASMGDVIFAMAPGFQTRSTLRVSPDAWIGQRLQTEHVSLFKLTKLFSEFTGEHDTAFPFTHAIHTMLFINGPGIEKGTQPVPPRLVDIAPTICSYLGIPFPAQCEGQPLYSVLVQTERKETSTRSS